MRAKVITFLLVITAMVSSCNAWRFGMTQNLAFNSYNLVTNDESAFGNRRIKYNLGYHKHSPLYFFLQQRGKPDFIYEYAEDKRYAINLYYTNTDSAYLFKETKKHSPKSSVRISARNLTEYEKLTYKQLLDASSIKK